MRRIDADAGSPGGEPGPKNREWVRGGRPDVPGSQSPTRARPEKMPASGGRGRQPSPASNPGRLTAATEFLLSLCGSGLRRAMYLASLFACASSLASALAWSAALPDQALAVGDPPDALHSPYVSVEQAREAGRVATEHPVPRPTLLEPKPAGEGPTYASGDRGSEPPLTFEDVNRPDSDKGQGQGQEFAQVEQPDAGSSPDSPPITFEDLEGPPPSDAPTPTRAEQPTAAESFPPTATASPSPEPSGDGGDDLEQPLPPSAKPGPTGNVIPTPELVPQSTLEKPPAELPAKLPAIGPTTPEGAPEEPPVSEEEPPPAEEPEGDHEEELASGGSPPWTEKTTSGHDRPGVPPQDDTSGEVPPQTSTEVPEEPPTEEMPSDEEPPAEELPNGEPPDEGPPAGEVPEENEGPAADQYDTEEGMPPDQPDPASGEPSATTTPPVDPAGDDAPGGEDQLPPQQAIGEQPSDGQPNDEHPNGEHPNGEHPNGERPDGERPDEQRPPSDAPLPAAEDDGPAGDQYDAELGGGIPPVGGPPPTYNPDPDRPADQILDPPDEEGQPPAQSEQPGPDDDPQVPEDPERSGDPENSGEEGRPMPDDVEEDLRRELDDVVAQVRGSGIIDDGSGSGGPATAQEEDLLRSINEANTAVEMARELAAETPEAREDRERAREQARSALEEARRETDEAARNEAPDGETGHGSGSPEETPPRPSPEPDEQQTPPVQGSPPAESAADRPPTTPQEEAPIPVPTAGSGPPPTASSTEEDEPTGPPPTADPPKAPTPDETPDDPENPESTTTPPARNTREQHDEPARAPEQPRPGGDADRPQDGSQDDPQEGSDLPKTDDQTPSADQPSTSGSSRDLSSGGDEAEGSLGISTEDDPEEPSPPTTAEPPITDPGVELKNLVAPPIDELPVPEAEHEEEKPSQDDDHRGG